FANLDAVAKELGVTVLKTAEGVQILAVAEKNLTESSNQAGISAKALDSVLAGGVGRMAAYELGAGRLGFVFGSIASRIPSLASALSTLFFPILAITFVDIISSLIDKFTKLGDEIRKSSQEFENIAFEAQNVADKIEIANLKLEDTVRTLVGGPAENRIAIAALEAQME